MRERKAVFEPRKQLKQVINSKKKLFLGRMQMMQWEYDPDQY